MKAGDASSDVPPMANQPQELTQAQLQAWFEAKAAGHRYEIEVGKLAQERGTGEIAQMGQVIEKDHTAALKQLQTFAERAGVTISDLPPMTPVQRAKLDHLETLRGPDFERGLVFSQDTGHRADILAYSWAKTNVTNEPVQQYVKATLPVLQKHHEKVHKDARQLAQLDREYELGLNGGAQLAGGGDAMGDQNDYRLSDDAGQRYYERRLQDLNYEAELGRVASERGTDDAVRQYGQQRSQQAREEARQIEEQAGRAGYDVTGDQVGMSQSQRSRVGEFEGFGDESFDREYVFEQTRQSVGRSFDDRYAAGQEGPQQQDAMASMERGQTEQQELQRLLILVIDPAAARGMQGMPSDEVDGMGDE